MASYQIPTLSLINIHFIFKNTNNNKIVSTIFVDLKKAFDVVDHNILIIWIQR